MNQDLFLDFWDIFVNEIVGDVIIFVILGIALITIFAIKGKIPTSVAYMLDILFVSIVVAHTANNTMWIFIITIIGVIAYYPLSKFIRR